MLRFDPETGLIAPSTAEIRAEVTERFKSAFSNSSGVELNTEPETPAGQLIDSITAIIADKNAEILYLANMFNPLTAEGIWQAALGKIYFLTPRVAVNSVATCTCSGLFGTTITEGAIIKSSSDNTQWKSLSTVTIPVSGSINVDFQCVESGPVSAGIGTLDKIVTVTPGWDSVTNNTVAVVGSNAESQIAFEKRRYASVAINAHGSLQAIQSALNNLEGVVDSIVIDNSDDTPVEKFGVQIPAHSIYVSVVGGNDSDIAEILYRKKDAGCGTAGNSIVSYDVKTLAGHPVYKFRITRPTPTPIKFKVKVAESNVLPGNYASIVKDAIIAEFNGDNENIRIGMAQTVYASRFITPVIRAGIVDVTDIDVSLNGSTWLDSVLVNADMEPTISEDDIEVELIGGGV